MSLKVLEIGVGKYLEFLDRMYGNANLDCFEMKSSRVSTPEIRIQRSTQSQEVGGLRIYDEYVFRDNKATGGYLVTWSNSLGQFKDISELFENFIEKTSGISHSENEYMEK